jgi:hypothetical protein
MDVAKKLEFDRKDRKAMKQISQTEIDEFMQGVYEQADQFEREQRSITFWAGTALVFSAALLVAVLYWIL